MYRVLIVCLTCIELWYENAVVVMILQIGENCIIRILKMLVMGKYLVCSVHCKPTKSIFSPYIL